MRPEEEGLGRETTVVIVTATDEFPKQTKSRSTMGMPAKAFDELGELAGPGITALLRTESGAGLETNEEVANDRDISRLDHDHRQGETSETALEFIAELVIVKTAPLG